MTKNGMRVSNLKFVLNDDHIRTSSTEENCDTTFFYNNWNGQWIKLLIDIFFKFTHFLLDKGAGDILEFISVNSSFLRLMHAANKSATK